ncbi:MAG: patatin-like phospholipase family protein [Candidatus Wallbacteria bacterium]|nr:patatin-like phospholipase family protein [Candidatus Wallbacteria bacterium]
MSLPPQTDLNRVVLRQINLFKDLPNRALDRLLGSFNLLRYPKGYKVLRQLTHSNNALYLIRSGAVRVMVADSRSGRERIVCLLGRGDVFGEMEILTGELIAATVETIFDSEFWVLSQEDFNTVLFDYPQMSVRLAILLSRRLRESNQLSYLRPTHHVLAVAGAGAPEKSAFLSINLASTLASHTGRPVALVDLDASEGPMERLLGHTPVRDTQQILSSGYYLLPEGIDRAILRGPQGFSVFGLKPSPGQRASADESLMPRLLSYLREIFSYIVVHAGHRADRFALKAAEQSDLAMLLPGGEWPETLGKGGSPEAFTVALEPEADSDHTVPVRSFVLDAFLKTGVPVGQSHPNEDEDRALSKLSRRARNARIGVALGSGTALGWCHVGVLKVLERERIPLDMIAGSSMGACIGGLRAMGMSLADICELARAVDQEAIRKWFDYNLPFPRDGLLKGDQMEAFLFSLFAQTEFSDLLIPLRVVASDVVTGERVVLQAGLIYKALRASSAIPGIFRMVELGGRHLVDGGVSECVPAQTLRDEGIQRIIAVSTTQPPAETAKSLVRSAGQLNIFEIIMRSTEILLYKRSKAHDCRGDVNINPLIHGIRWNELWRGPELIDCGEQAAEEAVPELKKLMKED